MSSLTIVDTKSAEKTVRRLFSERGITPDSVMVRTFPDETIVLMHVSEELYDKAIRASNEIDDELPPSVLAVIRKSEMSRSQTVESVSGVSDGRVSRLIELLNERSRTSELQPSLQFIKDAAENTKIAITKRHHVVFGRRGVGKTALLLEAKRIVEHSKNLTLWQNLQTLRGLEAVPVFLTLVKRICDLAEIAHGTRSTKPRSIQLARDISARVDRLFNRSSTSLEQASLLVPEIQRMLKLICAETGSDIFLFLDDFHYVDMANQPKVLDLLHGCTRDTATWIKIASIRNQSRLYQNDPPTGMQVGHDAAVISLDITLEEPQKAKEFLGGILQTYLKPAGISNRSGILSNGALDRLVLASAGVPRDFLLLAARSIQLARERANARVVGTQDVNDAAGEAGVQKSAELDEDAASSKGKSSARIRAMNRLRQFAIDEKHYSFFKVGFQDKNDHPDEYTLLQSLMDLRMIHIIKASLSQAHAAGEKTEVYMIDLSEYSGSRLKKNITVIDLQGAHLVLRRTGSNATKTVADTPRKVVQVLRTGPEFELTGLTPFVS